MGRKKVYKQLLCRFCHEPVHMQVAFGYWIVKEKDADGNNSFTFKCPKNPGVPKGMKLHMPMDNLSYLAWKHEQNQK